MALDIEGLSPKELDALISKAKQRKQKLQKRSPVGDVRKALAALAKKHGYTLEEIFGGLSSPATPRKAAKSTAPRTRKSTTKGSKVAAKYRHPDSGLTWSGRGIVPKWMAAEIAKGRSREDFAIKA